MSATLALGAPTGGSLVERAIQRVRDHIRQHDLKVGDTLPGEGQFASELGVSRAVMREAFGALSTVGLSFVIAIVLGAGLGLFLMRQFGVGRWAFFLFFVFGLAAGVLNVYRTAGKFLK